MNQIAQLKPNDQQVVRLMTEEQLTVPQIADQLNCSKDNVYRILRKTEVKELLLSSVRQAIALHSVGAVHTLARLSGSAKSEFVQLEASKALIDRAGIAQPAENKGSIAIQINLQPSK